MITLLRTSDCHGRSDSHYSRIVCTRCCRAGSPSARAPTALTARSAAAESPPLAEGILSTSRWETRTCTSARLSPSTTRASPIGAALSTRHHHLWHTTTPAHQQNSCACVRLALRFPHTCELAVCMCGVCARAGCVHVRGVCMCRVVAHASCRNELVLARAAQLTVVWTAPADIGFCAHPSGTRFAD